MRYPVVLALAVPVLAIAGAYQLARPSPGQTRTYFIAADEAVLPSGPAAGTGSSQPYRTAVYREYTDGSFSHERTRDDAGRSLDVAGPVIRASVGDTVAIVFRNRMGFPASLHADALRLGGDEPDGEFDAGSGSWSGDESPVPPGHQRVYQWTVPETAGPERGEEGSALWFYHTLAPDGRPNLVGPMIIYRHGALPREARGDRRARTRT